MAPLPYESLIGISYGLLTGFVPALLVGLVAVGVGLATTRSVPAVAGVAAVPPAIATGVALGVFDPTTAHAARIGIASIVAGVLGVVATSQGARVATELPRDRASTLVRGQSLSADAIDAVDAMGQVTIRPTGAVRSVDGYPPLSPALRTALANDAWRFPADLQLSELERRLERRLRTEYGFSVVEVSVDGRGRATVAAAPPAKGVARTLSPGTRAVTISGLLPTGIEPGDRVAIDAAGDTVRAEVLAVDGDDGPAKPSESGDVTATGRGPTDGFDGGVGRLTVAVETSAAGRLLDAPRHRVVVLPGGGNHEFEAAALLEEAGKPVTATSLDDTDSDDAATLGVRDGERWRFAVDEIPDRADRAFVAGAPPEVSD